MSCQLGLVDVRERLNVEVIPKKQISRQLRMVNVRDGLDVANTPENKMTRQLGLVDVRDGLDVANAQKKKHCPVKLGCGMCERHIIQLPQCCPRSVPDALTVLDGRRSINRIHQLTHIDSEQIFSRLEGILKYGCYYIYI